jgi:DNA-binding NarL/FixJ family response regulator
VSQIRVLIVEDCPPTLEGLKSILAQEADIAVVGEALSGQEALRMVEELAPDVVLLNATLPDMDGLVVLRRLREAHSEVQVLMVSAYVKYVCRAVVSGAAGYLYKDEKLGEIGKLVRRVGRGEQLWTKAQVAQARRWQKEVQKRWASLTEREQEVLGLLAKGKSNREIGVLLSISEKTAGHHVSRILSKLGTACRTEAALWAVSWGFVDLELGHREDSL